MTAIDVQNPDTATILNPATGAPAGRVRWTDPATVPALAAELREAQREWEQRGPRARTKTLARFAVWLDDHRDQIDRLLIAETGKSSVDAVQEVTMLVMIASYYVRTLEKVMAPEKRPARWRSWRSRRSRCITVPARWSASSRRGTSRSPTR